MEPKESQYELSYMPNRVAVDVTSEGVSLKINMQIISLEIFAIRTNSGISFWHGLQ